MKPFSTAVAILFAGCALVSAFPAVPDLEEDTTSTHHAASTHVQTHGAGTHAHHGTTAADVATAVAETSPAAATEPATAAAAGAMPTDTEHNMRVSGPAFPTEILNPSSTEYSPAKGRHMAKKSKRDSVQKANQLIDAHNLLPPPEHYANRGAVTGSVSRRRRQDDVFDPIMYANYAELEKKNSLPDSEHGHKIMYDADTD